MVRSKYIAKIVEPIVWVDLEKKYNPNPFISSSWLTTFSDKTKTPVYVVVYCNGVIVGLIAGIEEKSKYMFLKSISKVYRFFSGPHVIDNHYITVSECIRCVLNLSLKQGVQKVYFRSYCFHTNFSIENVKNFSKKFRSEFIIDLRCTVDQAWHRIKRKQRQTISKLEKMNVTFIENNSSESLNYLINGFGSVKERKTSKGHDVSYNPIYMDLIDYRAMLNLLNNNVASIYQIVCGEEILCSSFVIENKDTAYLLFFGSSEKGYKLGAFATLNWQLIQKYINEKVKFINLGGIPNDSSKWGIKSFKESLGAEEKLCAGGESNRIQPNFYYLLFFIYRTIMAWRFKI